MSFFQWAHSVKGIDFSLFMGRGEVSITSGMQMTPPLWQKVKNLEPLDGKSENTGLKLNIQKTRS